MKILNTIQKFHPDARCILDKLGDVLYASLSQKELEQKISEYDVLVVGLGLRVDSATFKNACNLKIIATPATGLDHIDLKIAKNKGIEVLSLRGEDEFLRGITGTAELAIGLLLSLVRHIPYAFDSVRDNQWNRDNFWGNNLLGKTLGIVGFGRLGTLVSQYARSLGMHIMAYDPYIKTQNTILVSFDELISKSDIISIHVHLSSETENMFNKKIFTKMKQQSYIINTSRGNIVNENDLIIALNKKQILGYATDVLSGELDFKKDSAHHSLIEYSKTHSNVIITPHIGGATFESRKTTDIFLAKKIIHALQN